MFSFNKNFLVLSTLLITSSCGFFDTVGEEKNEIIKERLTAQGRMPANDAIKQRIMNAEIAAKQENQRKDNLLSSIMGISQNNNQQMPNMSQQMQQQNFTAPAPSARIDNGNMGFSPPPPPQMMQGQNMMAPPAQAMSSQFAAPPVPSMAGSGTMERLSVEGYNPKIIPKNHGGDNPWQYMAPPSYGPANEVQRNEMMMKSNLGLHNDFVGYGKAMNAKQNGYNPQMQNRISADAPMSAGQNPFAPPAPIGGQAAEMDMQGLRKQIQMNDRDFEDLYKEKLNDPSIFAGALPNNAPDGISDGFAPTGYNSPQVGSQPFGAQYQAGGNPNYMPAAPAMPFPVNQQQMPTLQPPYGQGQAVPQQPYNQEISIDNQPPNLMQSMKPVDSNIQFQFKNDGAYVVEEGNSALPASMRKSYEKRKPAGFETLKFEVPLSNQQQGQGGQAPSVSNYGMMQTGGVDVPTQQLQQQYGQQPQPQYLYEQQGTSLSGR